MSSVPIAVFSFIVSAAALLVSLLTAWLTLLRRGALKMTEPSIVFLGSDAQPRQSPKVFLRALLYSTAARGQVVERLFARVSIDNSEYETFAFWGYGETTRLVAGSGLYVPQAGVAANHHFVLAPSRPEFLFAQGRYFIEVFAVLPGRQPTKLQTVSVNVTTEHAFSLMSGNGILFNLDPETGVYDGERRDRPD